MSTENPIKKEPGYHVGDKFFPVLRDAQIEAIASLIPAQNHPAGFGIQEVATLVVDKADAIMAILSPPKELRMRQTRKDKGTKHGPRSRRATTPNEDKPTQAPAADTPE